MCRGGGVANGYRRTVGPGSHVEPEYILHTILIQSFDSLPGFAEQGDLVRCSRQDMECTMQ